MNEPKHSIQELQQLASQLKKPTGEAGREVGQLMNTSNIAMTRAAIDALELKFGHTLLELGPGNADHLKLILDQAEYLNYFGLDISETMIDEAQRINQKWIEQRKAFFALYDGETIPFKENTFDAIMTVNTIYFWENPTQLLQELHRVLKPAGNLVMTFGTKNYMQQLPFVQYGFKLYDEHEFKKLVGGTAFRVQEIQSHRDSTISKTGEPVEREFWVARLSK